MTYYTTICLSCVVTLLIYLFVKWRLKVRCRVRAACHLKTRYELAANCSEKLLDSLNETLGRPVIEVHKNC